MSKALDLTGVRSGRLTAIRPTTKRVSNNIVWSCLCDCGKYHETIAASLQRGSVTSCGCAAIDAVTTHGMSKSSEYVIWHGMIQRCFNQKSKDFALYGARGISVSDSWRTFDNFYRDMGARPRGTTLDRINNNFGYSKFNCRWATSEEQNNNRRHNRLVTIAGETRSVSQWARQFAVVSVALAFNRLRKGIDPLRAFTTPAGKMKTK